jgi:hypothetical protein
MIALVTTIAALSPSIRAATNEFNVTASSSLNYTINGVNDPALPLVRGFTYTFNISVASFHPFYIKTAPGTGTGNQYNDGVSGQGVTSGTVTFDVPLSAPDTLYYQCSNHGNMTGPLNIVDPPSVNITELKVGSDIELKSTGYDIDTLNLNVLMSTNLTTNAWVSVPILTNAYANGTNTTTVSLPAEDAVFFQVEQGFF